MAVANSDILVVQKVASGLICKTTVADLLAGAGGGGGGSEVIVSDTPPDTTGLDEGTLWWNSAADDLTLYVLYNDPDPDAGLKWIEASPNTGGDSGGGGGGGSEVIVSTTAPPTAGLDEGTLWWNSNADSLQLYVLYNDPTPDAGLKWIEASPSGVPGNSGGGGGGSDPDAVKLNDGGLKQVIRSGGLGISDGLTETITLQSANGRINADFGLVAGPFDGTQDTNGVYVQGDDTSNGGRLIVQSSTTANDFASFQVLRGTEQVATIANDGSAVFTGSGNDNVILVKEGATENVQIKASGAASFNGRITNLNGVHTQNVPDSSGAFAVLDANGDAISIIRGDGSATFASTIGSKGTAGGYNAFSAGYGNTLDTFAVRGNGTIIGTDAGSATTGNYKYKIDSNGAATFTGNLTANSIEANPGTLSVNRGVADTSTAFYVQNPNGFAIELKCDGSAGFFNANASAYTYISHKPASTSFCLSGGISSDPAAPSWYVENNGNAYFPNVFFYAGTPDEINVRERLVKAKETFQELRTAVANATDFSELKAAMLTALDDYNTY